MDKIEFLLQEYISRKEQVLNLEMREFILLFALEFIFFLYFLFIKDKNNKILGLINFSVFLVILLEMIAINGKMGLISTYLKQMESYITAKGYVGMVWETKAIKEIIFSSNNAFTLPTLILLVTVYLQSIYLFYHNIKSFVINYKLHYIILFLFSLALLFLMLKAITVDFFHIYPTIF